MSDNVWFATQDDREDDTYERSSGFNGFPFSTHETGTTGDGTLYPLLLTQEELVELVWRIKKVKLSGSYLIEDFGTGPSDLTGSVSEFATTSVTRERNLYQYWRTYTALGAEPVVNPTPGVSNSWLVFGGVDVEWLKRPAPPFFTYVPSCVSDLSGLWPYFKVTLWGYEYIEDVYTGYTDLYVNDTVRISTDQTGFDTPTSAGTVTFMGQTIPLYYDDYGWTGGEVTSTLTLEEEEYWPYAVQDELPDGTPHPNAGLPIWDTVTGALLRDPLTGLDL